jgi:membrane protease YdiL (CAAX protease family)
MPLLNLAILAVFTGTVSLSLALWTSGIIRLFSGQPILAPEPRQVPAVGPSELLIGFGVMVLISGLMAPFLPPEPPKLGLAESPQNLVQQDSVAEPTNDGTAVGDAQSTAEAESGAETESDAETTSKQQEAQQQEAQRQAMLKRLVPLIIINSIATSIAALSILFWMRMRGICFRASGFVPTWRHVGIGCAGALMILPPVMILQGILASQIKYEHPLLNVLQNSIPWSTMLVMGISSSIIAPLVEELYFRGVLQGWLDRLAVNTGRQAPIALAPAAQVPVEQVVHMATENAGLSTMMSLANRPYWPGILASFAFAMVHAGQGPAPISLFFFSLGIAYLYRQTGSIWPGIMVHVILNGLTTIATMIASNVVQP